MVIKTKSFLSDYYVLTKPGITRMQLITVSIGYFLGGIGLHRLHIFIPLLIGTWCVASGCGALNHYVEQDIDALMDRTKERPLPSKRVPNKHALVLGLLLSCIGVLVHFLYVNNLTAVLSFVTLILYIGVYTPSKRWTWLNTFIGSIPGAIPILGGWAAATNNLALGAWVLFIILFTWQHPHFYALAIMYKDDYKKAKLHMLPVVEPDLKRTIRQTIIYTVLMIVSSIIPLFIELASVIYGVGMLVLGCAMLWYVIKLARYKTSQSARQLFIASIIYLPVWFCLIIIDFYITWT